MSRDQRISACLQHKVRLRTSHDDDDVEGGGGDDDDVESDIGDDDDVEGSDGDDDGVEGGDGDDDGSNFRCSRRDVR